jgi:hypothetical protein
VPTRAEINARAFWFQGLQQGWLEVDGWTADRRFFLLVQNAINPNACSYMVLGDRPQVVSTERISLVEGGSCNVMVTATAPNVGDIIEGTFSGAVAAPGSPLVTLTNGRFRVPRIADGIPPDS